MATVVSRLRRSFSFNDFRMFSRMGLNHRLHKVKIAILRLFWKHIPYCQDMSLFMDDLRSLNFPVFNATRS